MRRALIIGPGGLRGAYSGGVVATLCRTLGHGYFKHIYGCSAGAYTGSYAVSGQPDQIESIWRECVHANLLVDFSRVVRGKRPLLDLFYLNDVLRSDKYRLSITNMLTSPSSFEIVTTSQRTGRVHYFSPTCEEEFFLQVRASAAVPVFHPKVSIAGEYFVDGGLSDPIPIDRAFADGCDEVVIVNNRPIEDIGHLASTFIRIYGRYTAQDNLHKIRSRFKRVSQLAMTQPNRVHVITPSSNHSHRWQFDSSYKTLNQLVDLGISDATTFLKNYK